MGNFAIGNFYATKNKKERIVAVNAKAVGLVYHFGMLTKECIDWIAK